MVPEDFSEVIKCSGQILAAQGDESTLVAPVSGVVSFGKKVLADGTAVQKGSVLFVISGKGLAEGDPVEKARINYETARKDYQRAEELVKDKIISEKEFNRIYQEYDLSGNRQEYAIRCGCFGNDERICKKLSGKGGRLCGSRSAACCFIPKPKIAAACRSFGALL